MKMHNPPHPGEIIKSMWLDELNISARQLANCLNVAPSTVTRLINTKSDVTPDMAIRLSKVLGRTPQSWLIMQANYNLWHVEQAYDFSNVCKLNYENVNFHA